MPRHGSRLNPHNDPSLPGFDSNLPPGNTSSNRTQRSANVVNRNRGRQTGTRRATPRQTGIRQQVRPTVSRYYLSNGQPYAGNVIMINGDPYSTKGGTIEGSSQMLMKKKP
jgi:hypothetical protein